MDLPNEELNKLTNEELIQILVETRKENGGFLYDFPLNSFLILKNKN